MSDFKCVTIPADKKDTYVAALADILCWMNGFTQGGGEYSPDSIRVLRDISDMIDRAYSTIPPVEPKLNKDANLCDKAAYVLSKNKHAITCLVERGWLLAKDSDIQTMGRERLEAIVANPQEFIQCVPRYTKGGRK